MVSQESSLPIAASRRRWVTAACAMAMFMGAVEASIVATAMPTIVGDLGGFHLFSWVFAVYLLAQAVTILIYGRLADLYGRKRVFMISVGLFLLGSTLCGFARDMPSLIAFRALQGLGAGGTVPIAMVIVGDLYGPQDRARVQGYIGAVWGSAAVFGPVLGALLVAHLSWATVFWVNLPAGFLAILILALALDEERGPQPHKVDYAGSFLLMAGTGLLMLALVEWTSLGHGTVAALIAAAAVILALLAVHERRLAEPMLPFDLLRNRVVVASSVGALATGGVMMGVTAFVPTYVQGVMGHSALLAGFSLCSMSFGWTLSSALAGRIMLKSSYRVMAIIGGTVLCAGSVALILLDPTRGWLWAATGALLIGTGMGFSNTTFLVAAQSSVARNQRGIATSLSIFTRQFGQSLGAAIYGGILNAGLGHAAGDADTLVDRLMEPELRQSIPASGLAELVATIAGALHQVYLIVGATALIALALAFWLPGGENPTRKEIRPGKG